MENKIASVKEEAIWSEIRGVLRNSNCLKTQTAAAVVRDEKILSTGWNLCAPGGSDYGDRLDSCPRASITTGGSYELCSPVHAEVMSCLNIRRDRTLEEKANFAGHLKFDDIVIRSAFTEDELKLLGGSHLYLVGHYWACGNCVQFLGAVGIPESNIKLDKITGESTRTSYMERKIT